MRTVMLIDDDIWALADMRETFHFDRYGFEIAGEYRSAEDAVRALETRTPDLIVSDICMSAGSGLDLAALCAEKYPDTVIILVSGHERFDFAREAIRQGVFAYLLKPLLGRDDGTPAPAAACRRNGTGEGNTRRSSTGQPRGTGGELYRSALQCLPAA